MKPGREYEKFIYDKFVKFFPVFRVTLNDKITGQLSGIKREIDISIKGQVQGVDLLYITQCKDHNKPADIKIIGEFSSVIKDVGASKGFLICSSGFTKTIRNYAKKLGIELVTIEDINSERWKAEVNIPVIYIKKTLDIKASFKIVPNEEIIKKNNGPLTITNRDFEKVTLDGGKTVLNLVDLINKRIEEQKIGLTGDIDLLIDDPNLLLCFANVWVHAEFKFYFTPKFSHYLKFITPDEYSHLIDHVKNTTIPISMEVKQLSSELDNSYIQVDGTELPIYPGVSVEIEESLLPLKEINMLSNGGNFSWHNEGT